MPIGRGEQPCRRAVVGELTLQLIERVPGIGLRDHRLPVPQRAPASRSKRPWRTESDQARRQVAQLYWGSDWGSGGRYWWSLTIEPETPCYSRGFDSGRYWDRTGDLFRVRDKHRAQLSPLSTKTVRGRPPMSSHIRGRCHATSQSPRHPQHQRTSTDVPHGPVQGSKISAWVWTERASWP